MKTRDNRAALLLLTSVVCLLPLIMSIVVYDELPDQVAIHWDGSGEPDNFVPKAAAAFGLPFLFLAINLFTKLSLFNDPKRANTSQVMQITATWLPPLLSVVLIPLTLLIALGHPIPIAMAVPVLVGLLLVMAGNYLPKSRQNYTLGLKLPWTLDDPDNWNKTHRLTGYLYIAAGLVLIGGTFALRGTRLVSGLSLTVLIVIALVVTPRLYSYWLYKRAN
ncbi:MAG: SdpI family protein [Limnochordia bacterium]|jgi:uncharacterized membrane protein